MADDDDDKKPSSERRTVTLPTPPITMELPQLPPLTSNSSPASVSKPTTASTSGPKPAAIPPGVAFAVDLGSIASPASVPVVGGAAIEKTAAPTTMRPDYLPAGTELNSWIVEEKLGAGGMGAVYRVRHARSSMERPEFAALKVSLPPPNETHEARHAREVRFKREFAAIAALDHPNIVQPEEFFKWPTRDGYLCMVMPYVVGHTLDAYLMREHPPFRALLAQLMRPLADAIDYIHGKNVFHRDIKPANIMVRTKDGVPLLMDFGIARSKSTQTLTVTEILTTFEYSAPEYLEYIGGDERRGIEPFDYGPQSDIFCFGAAFFSLLTGYLPYSHVEGAHGPAGMLSLRFQRALSSYVPRSARSMNPAIPEAVDELLAKMMTRDLTTRFRTGEELVDAIDAVLAQLPAESPEWDTNFIPPERQRDKAPPKSDPARVPERANTKAEGAPRGGSVDEASGMFPLPDMSGVMESPPPPPALEQQGQERERTRSSRPPSVGGGGFAPPTAAGKKAGFQSVIHAAPPAVIEPQPDELPAGLLEAQKRLAASTKPAGNSKAVLVGGGLVIVVLLILVVASLGAPPATPATTSLLDEKEVKAEPTQPPPPMNPTVLEKPAEAPSQEPVVEEQKPLVVATGSGAKNSVRRGNSDSKAIDNMLKAEYGGERPTVGGGAAAPPKKKSWVAGLEDEGTASSENHKLGIPTGTEIPVRLVKPLDSRTTGSGPAIAKLSRAFTMRGEVLLPSGTMVYGIASAGGAGRFDVSFSKLKLPDGRELEFKAIAYDNDDKKPGLQPTTRTQASGNSKGPSVAGTVLKNTASSAIGLIPGDGAADLAKGAGQAVVQGAGQTSSGGQTQELLLLDAPTDFSLFVAEPF